MFRRGFHPAVTHARRGFTLIEAALATVIIGVGVASSARLFAACTQQNRASNQITTAMLLAANIRETMIGLPFDDPIAGQTHFSHETGETTTTYNDIDDFDGKSFNPPIDAIRQSIPSMSQYTQVVTVSPVLPNKLDSNTSETQITKGTYTGAVRVKVRILYRAGTTGTPTEVHRVSWIRVDN